VDRVPSTLVVTPVLRLHQAIYRGTRGWLGKRLIGKPSLLLTTLGRHTGRQRTNALIYCKDGSSWVVVASHGGSDHGPGWLANLRTEPHVRVQVGRR
jgi:deazaflavin-dependent oxidoreductase (nitroreductase family)